MKHLTLALLVASLFVPGVAGATARSTGVPLTQMVAGRAKDAPSPVAPAPTLAACTEAAEFLTTNCTLARYGITLYGPIDFGVTRQSHGTPFNSSTAMRDRDAQCASSSVSAQRNAHWIPVRARHAR
jgi:hypothetical protein